jgi:hypothetical protein
MEYDFPTWVPGQVQYASLRRTEGLALADESVDLRVTQDVLVHVSDPRRVLRGRAPPQCNGNSVSDRGLPVTNGRGVDTCRHIFNAYGLDTNVLSIDELPRGIRANYIEVLATKEFRLADGQGASV